MMDQKNLIEKIASHVPSLIGFEQCRKAAVCIPLIGKDGAYEVLFEVRAAHIQSQPGDVCFPGGMMEDGETPVQAALREMQEELLVKHEQMEVLGQMDLFWGSRLCVFPFAVRLRDYEGTFCPDEVAEVFTVPLSFFLEHEPEIYSISLSVIPGGDFPYDRIRGGRDYGWRPRREEIYFYEYEGRTIWGMTARILASFVEACKR